MRAKLVHFQTIMIGALGSIICIISFSLILLYQKTLLPLIHLSEQAREEKILIEGFNYSPDSCTEIAELAEAVNELLQQQQSEHATEESPKKNDEQLAAIINEGTNLSNGIINYAQLLSDSLQDTTVTIEDKNILTKIISAGERIATILKNI